MFILTLQKDPAYFFAVVITVVASITIHELAHGLVAIWLGDRTPIEQERMTLNPMVHLGPYSIIALLVAGIAWGAMPVNPSRLRRRHGDAIVSAAGPVSNVILALIALTALGLWIRFGEVLPRGTPGGNVQFLLTVFGFINIALAMFNMIPIPPLDGSGVLGSFSAGYKRFAENLMSSGASIIVFIIAFALAGRVIMPAAENAMHLWLKLVVN